MVLDNAPSWQIALAPEFDAPYMQALKKLLRAEKDAQKIIYPHSSNWFHANVKVVF